MEKASIGKVGRLLSCLALTLFPPTKKSLVFAPFGDIVQ